MRVLKTIFTIIYPFILIILTIKPIEQFINNDFVFVLFAIPLSALMSLTVVALIKKIWK